VNNLVIEILMKRKDLLKIASVIIAFVFIVFLLTKVSIYEVIDTLLSINPYFFIAGFVLYFFTYLLRSLRFSYLLNRTISPRVLFPLVCVHNMMTNILPSRSGELSYVYLLKRIHSRPIGEGVATLVVARIFDFMVLIVIFFSAGFFIQDIPQSFVDFLWIISLFLFFLVVMLIGMIFFNRTFMQVLDKIFIYLRVKEKKIGIYILKKGDEIIESLHKIHLRNNIIPIIFITFLIWITSYTCFYAILIGLGIPLPIQNVFFGAILILLAGILPTPGIAGFGTGQAIFTIVFIPLGMSLESAIISGFCWHIVLILFTLILGSLGSFIIKSES